MTNDLRAEIIAALFVEAEKLTVNSGGRMPAGFRNLAARFLHS